MANFATFRVVTPSFVAGDSSLATLAFLVVFRVLIRLFFWIAMLVSLFLFGDFVPVLVNQCKNRARLIARLVQTAAC